VHVRASISSSSGCRSSLPLSANVRCAVGYAAGAAGLRGP
jgi:hypothetical protein